MKARKLWKRSMVVLMAAVMVASATPVQTKAAEVGEGSDLSYDGYTQVWADEFNGEELNREDWNVELHDPAWVNAELQAYVDSAENIKVEDGKLVITPLQTDNGDGTYSYTSGRVNTQGKHDFTYGMFEASVKVPEGMGYLPAFWLMASDENVYGQWPRCGEIDIMEIMGQNTKKAMGTIHYGNPHAEQQGSYTLSEGDFSSEYHKFTCEWEPGSIKWYVDGKLFHEATNWHSTTEGAGTITYPAPFDQPFYVILNLAVGGSWVGYPDDASFVSNPYMIDYVRVYQKDSYDDSNLEAPSNEVVIRDPNGDGNYLINGDFEAAEDLATEEGWQFKTAGAGVGSAVVSGNSVEISMTQNDPATAHAIQLVQTNVPLIAGQTYVASYDAYASADRTIMVNSKAPNNGWASYLNATQTITTEKKTYTHEFKMPNADDAACTFEFNLGGVESTDTVVIDNVSLKLKNGEIDEAARDAINHPAKGVRADGNYIYNGKFQEGDKHLGYWNIPENADVSVTNLADGRRLKVVVPAEGFVTVSQSNVAVSGEKDYALSLDAEVADGGSVSVGFDGQNYEVEPENGSFSTEFKTSADMADKTISITFEGEGTYYIDNVTLVENALIKNGSFNDGFAGFETYADGSTNVSWGVDALTESNAASVEISDTGDADWKIQLKQTGVDLEKDQWYKLSFKIKSDKARDVSYAIQRDGNRAETKDDWTPYVQETISLVGDINSWQTIEKEFQMKEGTDLESVFNITMGAVGGTQITDKHTIRIDDIVLEKMDAPAIVIPSIPYGVNQIQNSTFEDDSVWNLNVWGEGAATKHVENGAMVVDVTATGAEDGQVALQQAGLTLEKGQTYTLSFDVTSDETRDIKACFMTIPGYGWYGGNVFSVPANEEKHIEWTFEVNEYISDAIVDITDIITLGIHLGNLKSEGTAVPAKLTFDNVSLVKYEKEVLSVKEKINAIGTVTLASKAKIDEARAAYNALTHTQKEQLDASVLKILTDAEAAYAKCVAAQESNKNEENPSQKDDAAKDNIEYVAEFTKKSTTIQKGKKSSALASNLVITDGDKAKEWTSSNKSVVSVDAKTGKITAKKVGTATITVTTEKGKQASIEVKVVKKKVKTTKLVVKNKATDKTLKNKSKVTLKKKETLWLKTELTPITSPDKVTYKSSNKKVVTVSSKGKITAKKKGKATITVKSGKKTVKIKVTVK